MFANDIVPGVGPVDLIVENIAVAQHQECKIGKQGQEVLVDTSENVATSWIVERAQDLPEDVVVKLLILGLGQGAAESFVVLFDPFHDVDDRLRPVDAVRQGEEMV